MTYVLLFVRIALIIFNDERRIKMMNFRNSDGSLALDPLAEVWVEYELNNVAGVLEKDGDLYYFNAYDLGGTSPLYLFSFVDEDVIQDMRNGRVQLREGFEHYSALIFKEFVKEDGTIEVREVKYRDLDESDLPEPNHYLS